MRSVKMLDLTINRLSWGMCINFSYDMNHNAATVDAKLLCFKLTLDTAYEAGFSFFCI